MATVKELEFFSSYAPDKKGYSARIRSVFAKHLAMNGLRLTKQRTRIVDCFLATDRHLSQDDLYKTLRRHGVGRATIFRSLKMLQGAGLIEPVTGSGGTPRYELHLERPHHDHLVCIKCGRIQEVRWPELEIIQERTCRKIGFVPRWHRHEIFGHCRTCAR